MRIKKNWTGHFFATQKYGVYVFLLSFNIFKDGILEISLKRTPVLAKFSQKQFNYYYVK